MPFQTKSYELSVPKAKVPKDSVRTITVPDTITVPSITSHADFAKAFNSDANVHNADAERRILHVQGDQRPVAMYMLHFAVSIYAALDVKKHPTITPMSLFAYMMTIYHAFHLANDKFFSGTQSRHANHFNADDTRRDYFSSLLRAVLPPQLESFLRLNLSSNDPRRPEIRYVPTYAGFSFEHDFGRFIPPSFALTAHNVLSTTQANSNPNYVFNHWLRQSLATDGTNHILSAGNLIGYYRGTTTNDVPETWFYAAVSDVMTPIVARTIAQRYVFAPVPFTSQDFSDVSNLSIGTDGSVNTTYDVTDINPYILGLLADDVNCPNMMKFIETMSENLEAAHIASQSLGSLIQEDSNIHILGHCYTGPALPTHSVTQFPSPPKLRTKPEEKIVDTLTPKEYANHVKFLSKRVFKPNTIDATTVFPHVPTGWKLADDTGATQKRLPFGAFRKLQFYSVPSTVSSAGEDPDKFIEFNSRVHYTPDLRILLPFDANPSEGYIPQITGRIIESAEIDGFTIRTADSRMNLSDENSQFLSTAVSLDKIHKMTTLAVSLHERYLPEPNEEAVRVALYNASEARFGRALTDADLNGSDINDVPLGHKDVPYVRFVDLCSNTAAAPINPTKKSSSGSSLPIPDQYLYIWSPYRFVNTTKSSAAHRNVYMLADLRPFYGLSTPLMSSDHFSVHFPKN
uniref:Coat protein n=1 Tax=Ceratobasidium partitivirus CP-f TaxID=1970091 RepID=A0A219WGK7_9VIRU|nr:coat protein [Ceratobasidium partitivirus CP-f]